MYRLTAIPIKIPDALGGAEIDKLILKVIWKCRGSTNNLDKDDKTIFKKKDKTGRLIQSGFKIYHKTK